MRHLFIGLAVILSATTAATPIAAAPAAAKADPAVLKAIEDPRRAEKNRARDIYRHPAETLAFFDVRKGQTVIEFYPGGGWYTEILAPLLKGNGRYVAMPPSSAKSLASAKAMLERNKDWFGPVDVVPFDQTEPLAFPAGTADRVLTFRNIHNLIMSGDVIAAKAFADYYAALKPGGILGVVEHRLPGQREGEIERLHQALDYPSPCHGSWLHPGWRKRDQRQPERYA